MIKIISCVLVFVISSGVALNHERIYDLFKVCVFVDIRFSVRNFEQLEKCKIVLGGLRISDIPPSPTNEDFFNRWSFRMLREITGYLQIENVHGLKSLDTLLPNLVVIRGDSLLHAASLIITNNRDLESAALPSLRHIGRNKIVIENNPLLCRSRRDALSLNATDGGTCNGDERWSLVAHDDGDCHAECFGGCYAPNDTSSCAACRHFAARGEFYTVVCRGDREDIDFVLEDRFLVDNSTCRKMGKIPFNNQCIDEHSQGYNKSLESCVDAHEETGHIDCNMPIVKFRVLPSHTSALVLFDRLKPGVDYRLWYRDRSNDFSKNFSAILSKDIFEITDLKPNSSYEIFVSSKLKSDRDFRLNTAKQAFETRAFEKFIEISNNPKINSTAIELSWRNLNGNPMNVNLFYIVEMSDSRAAIKGKRKMYGEYRYTCDLSLLQREPLGKYEKYYRYRRHPRTAFRPSYFTSNTSLTISKLNSSYCYEIAIYLCYTINAQRCTLPESQVFITRDEAYDRPLSTGRKIAFILTPLVVVAVFYLVNFALKYRKLQQRTDPHALIVDIIRSECDRDEYDLSLAALERLKAENFEILKEDVSISERIGGGQFGDIFEGYWTNAKTQERIKVAVKTVKNASDDNFGKFISEALSFHKLQTHFIVKAYGCVLVRVPWIVMEFMERRDLRSFLLENRPLEADGDVQLELTGYARPEQLFASAKERAVRPIYDMAVEIADAMAYLEFNKHIHRDLAARNCMVAADLTIKVGDFGMTKHSEEFYYEYRSEGAIPARWMSPESLDGKFSSKSDVWSYGVTLHEISTFGETPYAEFKSQEVVTWIKAGRTLLDVKTSRVDYPDVINAIMERCFKYKTKERPSFAAIVEELYPLINAQKEFRDVSFYYNHSHRPVTAACESI